MSHRLSRRAALAGAAALASSAAAPAWAKTVTLIVPYPPGGAVDQLGRLIAEKIEPALGATIVVENRGGAGGSIGTGALARAAPDGATLGLLNVTQMIVNRYLYSSLPYDPDKDLTPITRVASGTILCVANAERARERGWKTFENLIAWAKANPDQVRMGSSGVGTISHLGIELVKARTGAKIVFVPYKGGAPALVDLLGGVVDIMFDVPPILLPHVREGKLVALAVGSRERMAAAPEIPSMKELGALGLAEVDIQTWYAMAGPKGLPADLRREAYDAVAKAMSDPDVADKLAPTGFTPVTDVSTDAFGKLIHDQNPYWRELVALSGAKIE